MIRRLIEWCVVVAVFAAAWSSTVMAGPTLRSGDLVVIAYNADPNPRTFALLALADIPSGSVIFLTDKGIYDTSGNFTSHVTQDGIVRWTTTSIARGSIIRFSNTFSTTAPISIEAGFGTIAHVTSSGTFFLGQNGDQILIFQTSDDSFTGTSTSTANVQRLSAGGSAESGFIYAFNADRDEGVADSYSDANGWWTGAGSSTTSTAANDETRLPVGSTAVNSADGTGNATTADAFGRLTPERDNWLYSGSTNSATKANWLARIHTVANWSNSDTATLGLPLGNYTVLPDPPTVTSVSSVNGSYNAGDSLLINVTFSAAVSVTGTPQIQLNSGVSTYASYESGSGTATLAFRYTVASGENSSDLDYGSSSALTLNAGTIIRTSGGTPATLTLAAPGASGSLGANNAIVIDTVAPTSVISAPSISVTRGGPVTYTVTFSGANSISFNASHVNLHRTGSADAYTIAVSGSGNTRTVSVEDIVGTGTIAISVDAGTATDTAGNSTALSDTSTAFSVDNDAPAAPSITGMSQDTGASGSDNVTADTTLVFSGTAEANSTVALTLVGTGVIGTAPADGDGNWSVDSTGTALGEGDHTFHATATDALGNTSADSSGFAVRIDTTAPGVSISAPSPSATSGSDITYTVTYSGADVITLDNGSITLNSTGSADGTVQVSGSGNSLRTVTITGISGSGTLGISIAAGTASDFAGNNAAGAGPGTTFTVDTVNDAPTINGTATGQDVDDDATLQPFFAVTISDPDVPAETLDVTVTVGETAKGKFTTLNGFATNGVAGEYVFSGAAAEATSAIRGLVFTPSPNRVAPGLTENLALSIRVQDGGSNEDTDDTTTLVIHSINDAPLAGANSLVRTLGRDVKISLAELLANDSDADNDTLTVSLPSGTSTNGVTLTLSGNWLIYGVAPDNNADSFTYTVSDGRGGTATGTVVVTAEADGSQSANTVSIEADGADTVIRFYAIPGLAYTIQYTTSLGTPVWTDLDTLAPDAAGLIEYRDVNPPPPSRFYRTFTP